MRHRFLAASTAALALFSTPAIAQEVAGPFTGPRVGVVVGTGGDEVLDFDGQTIGIDAGYDFDMGAAVFGLGVEYQTDLGDDIFDVNETAVLGRIGGKIVGRNALVYLSGGYTRISDSGTPFGNNGEDGYRVGLGVEFALSRTSVKLEQRFLDYGGGANVFQTVAGLSLRF